jgi:hypothetical protein
MREQQKKKITQRIVDWMKGTDSDMPTIPSGGSEKPIGQGPYDPQVRERQAGAQIGRKERATPPTKIFGPKKDNTPSAEFGARLKKESNEFYNSDAGKNDGYHGMFASPNPNRKPQPLPTDGRLDKDYINGYFDNAAKKAKSDNYVTKKDDGNYMTDKGVDWKSIMADKGDIQKHLKTIPNSGLSDFEKGVIGGAGAAGAGAAAANSYWSRKKEQDRNGGSK